MTVESLSVVIWTTLKLTTEQVNAVNKSEVLWVKFWSFIDFQGFWFGATNVLFSFLTDAFHSLQSTFDELTRFLFGIIKNFTEKKWISVLLISENEIIKNDFNFSFELI